MCPDPGGMTVRGRIRAAAPAIIGIAGGIGSGKSALTSALAALGFMAINFDAEARRALDRPGVRETLLMWWGEAVLGPDGRIDRRKVADLVFADSGERVRLERLIHPLITPDGEALRARARESGKPGVVLDAPLLFEAGLDRLCDFVVFVDAPADVRRARVASRGWSADELARREASQMPLEEKQARCQVLVENAGDRDDLAEHARRILGMIDR